MPLLGELNHQAGIRYGRKPAGRGSRDHRAHSHGHGHNLDDQCSDDHCGNGNLDGRNAVRVWTVWGHGVDWPDRVCIAIHLHV